MKKKGLGVPPRKASGSRVAGVSSPKKATAASRRPSTRSRAYARSGKVIPVYASPVKVVGEGAMKEAHWQSGLTNETPADLNTTDTNNP